MVDDDIAKARQRSRSEVDAWMENTGAVVALVVLGVVVVAFFIVGLLH
jgi:hypothetical protein